MSGSPKRRLGPLPQYKTNETGSPSAISSEIMRNINCGSAGCSRLNAHVLNDRSTVSALIVAFV